MMETTVKKLKVSAIENGTVLDHIPANQLFKVINILNLTDCKNQVTDVSDILTKY